MTSAADDANQDFYEILGVAKTATRDEIKLAYSRLARKYSSGPDADEERWKVINDAYATLSDPKKRESYDSSDDSYKSSGPASTDEPPAPDIRLDSDVIDFGTFVIGVRAPEQSVLLFNDGGEGTAEFFPFAGSFWKLGVELPEDEEAVAQLVFTMDTSEDMEPAAYEQAIIIMLRNDVGVAIARLIVRAKLVAASRSKPRPAPKTDAKATADAAAAKAAADAKATADAAAAKAAADAKATADAATAKAAADAKATADAAAAKAAADARTAKAAADARTAKAAADARATAKAAADAKATADAAAAKAAADARAAKAAADARATAKAAADAKVKAATAKAAADNKKVLIGLVWIVVLAVAVSGIIWLASKPSQNELLVQDTHVAIQCFFPEVVVPYQATDETQKCTESVKPSGVRYSELVGIKALDVANLCTNGYKENWSDNQGNSSDVCYRFDESADGWLVAPFTKAPAKPGPWTITWRMTSPSGKVVLEASYKANEATPEAVVPLPAIPTQVVLTCITQIGPDCLTINSGGGAIVYLGLTGINESTIAVLCSKGYKAGWTQNFKVSLDPAENDNYTRGGTCKGSTGGGDTGTLEAEFTPPFLARGPWVITWRLTAPSGKVVLEANYHATLVHD